MQLENDYNQETIIDKNGTYITSMWFNRVGAF